jgi:hypothetical protein
MKKKAEVAKAEAEVARVPHLLSSSTSRQAGDRTQQSAHATIHDNPVGLLALIPAHFIVLRFFHTGIQSVQEIHLDFSWW